jgi:hypothetical protein
VEFVLRYAADSAAPTLTLHFIGFADLPVFLVGRKQGSLPYGDLSGFPPLAMQTAEGPVTQGQRSTTYTMAGGAGEGLYLAIVSSGEGVFSATVASRIPTLFPRPGVSDLTDVIVPYVNSSDRHGRLFLVLGCVWFARNMLNVTISDQVAAELNGTGVRPPWPTLQQPDIDRLVSGNLLAGVDRIWLIPPGAVEEDEKRPCMISSALRETPPEGGV